jgi:hypothetical protein
LVGCGDINDDLTDERKNGRRSRYQRDRENEERD